MLTIQISLYMTYEDPYLGLPFVQWNIQGGFRGFETEEGLSPGHTFIRSGKKTPLDVHSAPPSRYLAYTVRKHRTLNTFFSQPSSTDLAGALR